MTRYLRFASFLAAVTLGTAIHSQTAPGRWHDFRFADDFSGANSTAKINAAIADCGAYSGSAGNSCVVVIPAGMACGEPLRPPDHVMLWDLRACAQSTGLRLNLSAATTGNVRSKVYLQDNYKAESVGLASRNSSATFYVTGFVDDAEVAHGVLAAINGSMFVNRLNGDMSGGHIIGIEGSAIAATPGSTVHTVWDMRGGTFNAEAGKNVRANSVTSLYAQAPEVAPGGSARDVVSFQADAATGGTEKNLSGWFHGDVQVDTRLKVGNELVVGNGTPVHAMRLSSANLSYPSIEAHSCQEASTAVAGADSKSVASASPGGDIGAGLVWSAWVKTEGNVTVRVCNVTDAPATPRNTTWNVQVIR